MNAWAKQKQTGFTIVELLIVIVVIAILAAISVVAYTGIQQRARDNIRKADIEQIAKALELHYIDYGIFTKPGELCSDTSFGKDNCDSVLVNTGSWAPDSDMYHLVDEGYMATIPEDPINNETYKYTYEPWNVGQGGYTVAAKAYDLCATLEAGGTYCVNRRT